MSENDIQSAIRDSIKFPLTAQAKIAFEFNDRLDKEWENVEKCEAVNIQSKAIENIKAHIAQRKKILLCHQNDRFQSKIRQQQNTVDSILNKQKLNIKNERTRQIIADKIMLYNNNQRMKKKMQKERMMNIIQKITTDYEWKDKQNIPKKSTWRPRTKIIPEPSIKEEEQIIEEIEEEQEWEEIVKPKKKVKKEVKAKKGKKEKKEKSKKSSEKKSHKESRESKKGKKKEEEVFEMPIVQITNLREKIKPDENQKMVEQLSHLHHYEDFVDEENEFYRNKDFNYPINKKCASRPPFLLFQDFENNKVYKQKLNIHNNGSDIIICKYQRIICANEFESTYIQVEEVGQQKLLPGRFFPVMVQFVSRDLKHLEGELVFITQRPGIGDMKQFSVPFKCQIATINIKVSPKNIIFKSLPIWEIKNGSDNSFKIIEVQNNMIHACILVIKKVKNQEEDLYETTPQKLVEDKKYTSEVSLTLSTVELFIAECMDQISNIFQFSSYFYSLPPKSVLHLKVFWRNGPFVGAHQEIFQLEFSEKRDNEYHVLQNENILVQTQITGKFIETDNEYLDYNICIINSIYQQPFNVYNYGTYPVKIGLQYPSKLKEYFTAYPSTFFLKPNNHENVSLRFIPRKEILTSQVKYFDPYTHILSCPIKIVILSGGKSENIPPTIITLYAILSEADNIKLRLTSQEKLEEDGCPVIYLGQVTIQETVTADFEIENLSPVKQDFAFLNLPPPLSIKPNYGFGSIEPNEVKKMYISLSPNIFDMITEDYNHSTGPLDVSYKIFCNTTYKLGGVRPPKPDDKKQMLKEAELLEMKFNKDFENIDNLFSPMSEETTSNLTPDISEFHQVGHWIQEEELLEEEEAKITKKISLIIKATIVDYWTELSHQFVIFPDTPLGSFTTMDLLFSAVNHSSAGECVCGHVKKDKHLNFDCHFEVTGGCPDITIEPICGDLKKGDSVHLLVTAKPTVEYHVLQQIAKIFRVQRLATMRGTQKKGKKEKEDKKGDTKKSGAQTNDQNIILDNCDYYPAEKEIAKTMRPYTITTKFTFLVTFPEHLKKENEILYLTAECKVIRPDFITNLATQYINFGPTVIQTRPKSLIILENISRRVIHPKISPLNPSGPFICSTQIKNHLEKEHLLKIPISFAPTEEIYYKEYFEIKSRNTTETVMVSGEGVQANYEFVPKFTVCRIEAKFGKSTECAFQINNNCKAPIILKFVKLCELKGIIEPKPIVHEVEETTGSEKSGKDKKSKKSEKSSQGKKAKEAKPKKFSEDFSPSEEYSLENFFEPYKEESQFTIMNAINDVITVGPMSKLKIKIRFETPKKPGEKIEKGKGRKDISSKSSSTSKTSQISKKPGKGVKFVAKYNIMLGNLELIKDFVIIAEFK